MKRNEKELKQKNELIRVMKETTDFMPSWNPKSNKDMLFKETWLKTNRHLGLWKDENQKG